MSNQHIWIERNKNDEDCKVKCNEQCLGGCWGPGPTQCQSCKNFRFRNDCFGKCDNGWVHNVFELFLTKYTATTAIILLCTLILYIH